MTVRSLHFRFPDSARSVEVRSEASELGRVIESFYAAYRCPALSSEGRENASIVLRRANGGYVVSGPSGEWEAGTPGDAVLYYESELTGALLADAGAYVHLHGAAVCDGSRCLVLLGPSGSGKSTLSLGLCRDGVTALADDALLIDPASGAVQPFERSLRVHELGLAALGLTAGDLPGALVCGPYLWLSPAGSPGPRRPCRPAALVFLEAGPRGELVRLGAAERLRRLLLARLGDAAGRDFDSLAALAATVPGYRLAFAGFAEALATLRRLRAALGESEPRA